jgi:hypothetical protein
VRERNAPYIYRTFSQHSPAVRQQHREFEQYIMNNGILSSLVSTVAEDNYLQFLDLGFNFTFFGNMVDEIAVNADGLISLPPILDCVGASTSVEVRCNSFIDCCCHIYLALLVG